MNSRTSSSVSKSPEVFKVEKSLFSKVDLVSVFSFSVKAVLRSVAFSALTLASAYSFAYSLIEYF
jgi:hypothetical protein